MNRYSCKSNVNIFNIKMKTTKILYRICTNSIDEYHKLSYTIINFYNIFYLYI